MKYYKVLGYLDNDVILYENNACNIARDMIKCNYRDEKICFIVNDSNLNYSKYFDKEKQCITSELAQKRDWVVMPHVFNINLNRIMTLDIVKELGLEFGEVKSLIKWF